MYSHFRRGFIFASQTSQKCPLQSMSIYNIIMKTSEQILKLITEYKIFETYAVTIKISMTEYHQ